MARRITFVQGGYYHIYNRGCQRLSIFYSEETYRYLTHLLEQYSGEFNISVIAYCLMPNHYHLLLRQDGKYPISVCMQRLFNRYVKAFNVRYIRSGTLFEGPYKSIHIDDEIYLTHLCAYIHRNPVKAGLVNSYEEWEFSNYREWIGIRESTLIDREFVSSRFSPSEEYRRFVIMSDSLTDESLR